MLTPNNKIPPANYSGPKGPNSEDSQGSIVDANGQVIPQKPREGLKKHDNGRVPLKRQNSSSSGSNGSSSNISAQPPASKTQFQQVYNKKSFQKNEREEEELFEEDTALPLAASAPTTSSAPANPSIFDLSKKKKLLNSQNLKETTSQGLKGTPLQANQKGAPEAEPQAIAGADGELEPDEVLPFITSKGQSWEKEAPTGLESLPFPLTGLPPSWNVALKKEDLSAFGQPTLPSLPTAATPPNTPSLPRAATQPKTPFQPTKATPPNTPSQPISGIRGTLPSLSPGGTLVSPDATSAPQNIAFSHPEAVLGNTPLEGAQGAILSRSPGGISTQQNVVDSESEQAEIPGLISPQQGVPLEAYQQNQNAYQQTAYEQAPEELSGVSGKNTSTKRSSRRSEFAQEQPDIASINPRPSEVPITSQGIAGEASTGAQASYLSPEVQVAIDQIIDKLYTLTSSGQTDTVMTLKYPPAFSGAEIVLSSFDSAKGEFNIAFHNLSPEALSLIGAQNNQQIMRQALEQKGYLVHIVVVTSQPIESRLFTETEDLSQQDQGQGESQGGGQGQGQRGKRG